MAETATADPAATATPAPAADPAPAPADNSLLGGEGEQAAAPAEGQQGQQQADSGQEGEPKGKPDSPNVPDSYQFDMPEGMDLDTAAAYEFSSIAKELKLSQDDANKVAQVGVKMAQRQQEAHIKQVAQWAEEVKADPDIGGDKLDRNLAYARKALDTFGTPELKQVLNQTGMGNHPELVKLLVKLGKATSDDDVVHGAMRLNGIPAHQVMYPTMQK